MRKNIVFMLLLFSVFPCHGQSITDYRSIFDYDKGLNLYFQVLATKDSAQGTIQDIVYTSINGVQVTGCLVIPKQKIKEFPVIIFFPDVAQSKSVFLSHALDLASEAFASLLLDSPVDRPDDHKYNFRNFTEPRKDFSGYRQSVFDIRRAIDLLEKHERIDRNRIAFVGCGTGAMVGAIVSGAETRMSSYILLGYYFSFVTELHTSTDPTFVKARDLLESDQVSLYETVLKPIEPSGYLPYHRNSYIFFQFAQSDPYYSDQAAKDAFKLTKEPKRQKFYKATNAELPSFEESARDRKDWLKNHL
jgi:hypothetical protein